MMKNATRIKIAAVTTALVLGGLTAGGLAMRGEDAPPQDATAASKATAAKEPVVVHRRKVKTIVADSGAGTPTSGAQPAAAQTSPATVAMPESLGALRSATDDDEYEDEDEDEDYEDYEDDHEDEEEGDEDD